MLPRKIKDQYHLCFQKLQKFLQFLKTSVILILNFTRPMRLPILISRYQNTFQKLKIRIQRERRLFHFNRNNVD